MMYTKTFGARNGILSSQVRNHVYSVSRICDANIGEDLSEKQQDGRLSPSEIAQMCGIDGQPVNLY
jgi:hypothetical protein